MWFRRLNAKFQEWAARNYEFGDRIDERRQKPWSRRSRLIFFVGLPAAVAVAGFLYVKPLVRSGQVPTTPLPGTSQPPSPHAKGTFRTLPVEGDEYPAPMEHHRLTDPTQGPVNPAPNCTEANQAPKAEDSIAYMIYSQISCAPTQTEMQRRAWVAATKYWATSANDDLTLGVDAVSLSPTAGVTTAPRLLQVLEAAAAVAVKKDLTGAQIIGDKTPMQQIVAGTIDLIKSDRQFQQIKVAEDQYSECDQYFKNQNEIIQGIAEASQQLAPKDGLAAMVFVHVAAAQINTDRPGLHNRKLSLEVDNLGRVAAVITKSVLAGVPGADFDVAAALANADGLSTFVQQGNASWVAATTIGTKKIKGSLKQIESNAQQSGRSREAAEINTLIAGINRWALQNTAIPLDWRTSPTAALLPADQNFSLGGSIIGRIRALPEFKGLALTPSALPLALTHT
jgi:hypothetical protein